MFYSIIPSLTYVFAGSFNQIIVAVGVPKSTLVSQSEVTVVNHLAII